MTIGEQTWSDIHPSVYHSTAGPLRTTVVLPRPHGALKYRCPVTGSFILITEEATLNQFVRPRVRLRCADCGEMHLLMREEVREIDDGGTDIIVAGPANP